MAARVLAPGPPGNPLLGVLIAVYGRETGYRAADAASVGEPAFPSDPPSNEISELPQLG